MTTVGGRGDLPEHGRQTRPPGLATRPQRESARHASRAALLNRLLEHKALSVVVIAAIVAAPALLLRLWAIDSLGLNSDEAVYAGQAASLTGDPAFLPFFPVFRAHPLLFQSALSAEYHVFGVNALGGRLLSAAFGLATVWMTYAIGSRLYARRVGLLAALLIGVMPYLVIVNRQILLDGPMTFFSALALYLLVRFVQSKQAVWLYAAAAGMGLAVLSKETAILMVGSAYVFFALTRKTRPSLKQAALATLVLAVTVLPYPLSLKLAGRSSTGGAFLGWQLTRRANHTLWFYPEVVPMALGIGVVLVVVVGLLFMRRSLTWSESLLLSWVVVPCIFFEVWSVKGFQYLLPIAVPLAVLAAMIVISVPVPDIRWRSRALTVSTTGLRLLVAGLLVLSLAITSWVRIQPAATGASFLAGTGGVPGGREAGAWVAKNAPTGAEMLSIGPSMANIIQFYGHHKVMGLSVSPNPLHRNPVYDPVVNPDLQIRQGNLQFLVWDSFSASRSSFFATQLLNLAERYHGQIVHQEFITVGSGKAQVRKPIITIYEVRS